MRDRILRLFLHAYPAASRVRDGRAIIDLARELSAKNKLTFLWEAGGMLVGGVAARFKLVGRDFTGAPWRAARERLALPLAVAMLCLFLPFGVSAMSSLAHGQGLWLSWWSILGLLGAVFAVFGSASGRRLMVFLASALMLGLLAFDAFDQVSGNSGRWWGDAFVVELNILAMWLPAPVLLLICAGAVGRTGLRRKKAALRWMVYAPVATCAAVIVVLSSVLDDIWGWSSPLGGLLIWVPLALIVATIVQGVIRRDYVLKTGAALLVVAVSLPLLWLSAGVIREPYVDGQYLPFAYYLPGVVAAFLVMLVLVRRRETPKGDNPAGVADSADIGARRALG
jgi:hypothetical protein